MLRDSNAQRIIAVSGGVDSVVLLHRMTQKYPTDSLVVAHVDHGIRQDSVEDASFVKKLAREYGCDFRLKTVELGERASELEAREVRYKFLHSLAKEYKAPIYTAHHADDVVESVAINLIRGTGWRGAAVMNTPGVVRPLTHYFKGELIQYAKEHSLGWREDSTNKTDKYLRNRLRQQLESFTVEKKLEILALWSRQKELASVIDYEASQLATNERHFYIMSDETASLEVLRRYLADNSVLLTRPQLRRILVDIKVKKPGTVVDLSSGATMQIGKRTVHINNNQ